MSIRALFLVVFAYKHSSSLSPLLPFNIFFSSKCNNFHLSTLFISDKMLSSLRL